MMHQRLYDNGKWGVYANDKGRLYLGSVNLPAYEEFLLEMKHDIALEEAKATVDSIKEGLAAIEASFRA